MARRIQLRRDTAANWASTNPVLAQGEVGIDLTNVKIKIGNGTTAWNTLTYFDDKETDFAGYATTQYVDDKIGNITIPADISDLTDTTNLLVDLSAVNQSIIPDTDVTYDLGSPTNRFRTLYLSGNTIDLGGALISTTDDGNISIPGLSEAKFKPESIDDYRQDGEAFFNGTAIPEDSVIIDQATWAWATSGGNQSGGTFQPSVYSATFNGSGFITAISIVEANYYDDTNSWVTVNTDNMYVVPAGTLLTAESIDAFAQSSGPIEVLNAGVISTSESIVNIPSLTIPADVSDLTDTTNLLFDGSYNSLTDTPTIPTDVNQLDDIDNLLDIPSDLINIESIQFSNSGNEAGKINNSVSDGGGLQIEADVDFEIKVAQTFDAGTPEETTETAIWSFDSSGGITFPDDTVQTTAYTGSNVNTTVAKTNLQPGQLLNFSSTPNSDPLWPDGTFVVTWDGGGSASITISNTEATVTDSTLGTATWSVGDELGRLVGTEVLEGGADFVLVADSVRVPLDLTKTINKLTYGSFSLANGVEGQIMYFVPASPNDGTTYISVANARIIDVVDTGYPVTVENYSWTPFFLGEGGEAPRTISTAIFTDGAWNLSGGLTD